MKIKKLHLRRILLLMIICFISTGFLNAQNCTPSASNPDTDGDGIADVCDLDDDNDGILDMDEDCPFLAQNASGAWIGQTTANATVTTNGLVPLNQASNIHDFQNRFYIGQNGAGECIDRSGDVDHRISFSSPVPASELAIYIDGLTPSISTSFVNIRIVVNGTTANNIFATAIPISNGSNYLNYDAATGHVTSSSSNAQSLMLKGVGNTLVSSVQIISSGISPSDRLYYSFYGKKRLCDADNDGVSNHLDLDSDDDGCPDAIEGAENVVSTQLNSSGAIATNAAGVMNVSNIASVNTNGVPLLVNSGGAADTGTSTVGSVGQPIGTSQIFNPQAVAGTASADQVIIAGTAPTPLTLIGHTGTIRWQVSTNNITFTNITPAATGTSYSPGALTATRYYRATVANDGGCTVNTNVVTITVIQCTPSPSNPDSDGDGIADVCDLDDDNDGILDADECSVRDIVVNGNFSSALTGWSADPQWLATAANTARNEVNGNVNSTISQTVTGLSNLTNGRFELTMRVGAQDFNNALGNSATLDIMLGGVVYATLSNSSTRSASNVTITLASGVTSNFVTFGTNGVNATVFSSPFTIQFPYSGPNSAQLSFRMNGGSDDWAIDDISILVLDCADTDGDGIPNKLDLDSDNDGCPDAIEGGAAITTTVAAAGTLQGGNTGTTSGAYNLPILQNLGNTVDTNPASTRYGVPTAVAAGQSVGTSQTANTVITTITAGTNQTIISGNAPAAISLSGTTTGVGVQWQVSTDNSTFTNITTSGTGTSYSPGALTATRYYRALLTSAGGCTATTNVVTITVNQYCYENPGTSATLKPVKHGITVLGRAGKTGANGNANDWPMVRNSAYTALEGKTKGFVITRIANPETAITDPKIGMMVFDTDADSGKGCLKINTDGTSTGWKCFTKQSCP